MSNQQPTRHIQTIDIPNGEFDANTLIGWYHAYQPIGSGPTTMARHMCALIEELASLKGVELPEARGIKTERKKGKR